MKKAIFKSVLLSFFLVLASCSQGVLASTSASSTTWASSTPHDSCAVHPDHYPAKSAELQTLVAADQADRAGPPDSIDWRIVSPRDLERRIQVAEIFAEGCFKEAKDYAAAAMVYQHGDTADHVYQAFIWSKKAVDLGDAAQKWLMAAALDRYLVRTGQMQLFGTQGGKDPGSPCWCLEPTESSFPDEKRVEYTKLNLEQAQAHIHSLNVDPVKCPQPKYCQHMLKASPVGTVPGFW